MESHKQMQNSIRIISLCCVLGLVSGCSFFSVYKRDIPQGNLVTEQMVSQLQVGMTREQVVYVMGGPLLDSPFNVDKWDYVYQVHLANGQVVTKRVSLDFNDNRVAHIAQSGVADSSTPLHQTPGASEDTNEARQVGPAMPIRAPGQ